MKCHTFSTTARAPSSKRRTASTSTSLASIALAYKQSIVVVAKNMGLPELLFDYDIEDMQMHIYPANPAYLRLDKGDEGDVTQDVLTVEKGQRIFAGRAVLCFKPLAPAGKFLSPMARRAYRKGARHEN